MRVSDNVEMLEIAGGLGITHPVLLWDQNDVILVDTSYPLEIKLIGQAVQAAGLTLEKINKIILTHQDIDHIGSIHLDIRPAIFASIFAIASCNRSSTWRNDIPDIGALKRNNVPVPMFYGFSIK